MVENKLIHDTKPILLMQSNNWIKWYIIRYIFNGRKQICPWYKTNLLMHIKQKLANIWVQSHYYLLIKINDKRGKMKGNKRINYIKGGIRFI